MKKTKKFYMTKKSGQIIRNHFEALNDWYFNQTSLSILREKYKLKSEFSQVVQNMNIGKKIGKNIICILDSSPSFEMAQSLYMEIKKYINMKNHTPKLKKTNEPKKDVIRILPQTNEFVDILYDSMIKSIDSQNDNIISSMIKNSLREDVINDINPLIDKMRIKAKEKVKMYLNDEANNELNSIFK